MKWIAFALLMSSLVLAAKAIPMAGAFANKALVICKTPYGTTAKMVKASEAAAAVSQLRSLGCVPIVDHFYTLKILSPNLTTKYVFPTTSSAYVPSLGNAELAWQLDANHMNALSAWSEGNGRTIGVVVIDTGIARNLSAPMVYSVDYADGIAITAGVDAFAQLGICNDTGVVNLGGYLISAGPFNYTVPSVDFKYCLRNEDVNGDNVTDTVVYLQATELSDQVGHGTFVASQIVGAFSNVKKIVFESPLMLAPIGNVTVDNLITGVAPPFAKNKVVVIPVKADFAAIVVFSQQFGNLTTLLDNLTVTTANGEKYLTDAIIVFGVFDDFSLEAAAQYAAQLARVGKAKVVNMSLGGWTDIEYYDQTCEAEVEPMINAGLTVVAAAGNDGLDMRALNNLAGLYEVPAQCPGVVSVSAFDPSNSLAEFSNYDPVTFGAPGMLTLGLYPKGSYLYLLLNYLVEEYQTYFLGTDAIYGYDELGNLLAYSSGTSYASPEVAGAIAYLYSLGYSLNDIKSKALDISLKGYDMYSGYGMPALGAVMSSEQQTGTTVTTTVTVAGKIPALGLLALPFVALRKRKERRK